MSLQQKRQRALAYLKARSIYVLDGQFTPSDARDTDIRRTIAKSTAADHAAWKSIMSERISRR